MPPIETLGYAFLGGVLPALIWLEFIIKEEGRCPGPRWVTVTAFIVGMLAVPLVLPLERAAADALPSGLPTLIAWATIEETMKYLIAAVALLWSRKAIRNSLDVVVCMLTVSLGFAALENAFFLFNPLLEGQVLASFLTGNLRFIGATLLHVVASSAIAFALAFTYRSRATLRAFGGSIGLILAIALHTLFNFFIISEDGSKTVLAFFIVWTGAVVLFAAFEILKYFRYRNLPKNVC